MRTTRGEESAQHPGGWRGRGCSAQLPVDGRDVLRDTGGTGVRSDGHLRPVAAERCALLRRVGPFVSGSECRCHSRCHGFWTPLQSCKENLNQILGKIAVLKNAQNIMRSPEDDRLFFTIMFRFLGFLTRYFGLFSWATTTLTS